MSCCSRLDFDLWIKTQMCGFCGVSLDRYDWHKRLTTGDYYCNRCWNSTICRAKCAKCKVSLRNYRAEALIQFDVGDEDVIFHCEDCYDPDA